MYKYNFVNGDKLKVGTMFGIGKNYAKHAKEMGGGVPKEPVVFIKPPTSYVSDGSRIKLPEFSDNIHHEVELVVVIGKDCKNVRQENALKYIAGYGVGIDLTLRDIQSKAKEKGYPWAVAKGFYQSAPISKIISTEKFNDEIPFFDLELKVNDELKQSSNTKFMERSIGMLIEYLSNVFTLQKGDCIFTGTPEGVGAIKSGDKIQAELIGLVDLKIEII